MRRPFLILAFFILLFRLISLDGLALIDPSEGRYAVIAQNMYLSGDWVTPVVFDDGSTEPFLGKPPLQFWLTSLSFHCFGFSAFAARLPSFVASFLMLAAMWAYVERAFSKTVADLGVLLSASSISIFLFSGSCMLDPLLACTVTVAVAAFAILDWSDKPREIKVCSYLFFAALAAGMLAKGPVAVILVGAVIGPWVLWWRRWGTLRRISWLGGIALFLAIALPWYIYAELRSPGFLYYFIVQENFLRYLVKNYGDRYGSGHRYPYGTVWPILFISIIPWAFYLLRLGVVKGILPGLKKVKSDENLSYLFLCAVIPCCFFTLAKQLTIAYVLPSLPGVGMLFAVWFLSWNHSGGTVDLINRILSRLFFVIAVVIVLVSLFLWRNYLDSFWAIGVLLLGAVALKWSAQPGHAPASVSGVGSFALSIGCLLAVGSLSISPWIDGRMSSRPLLDYLAAKDIHDVAFFQRVPQSSYFYARSVALSSRFYPYLPDTMTGVFALTEKQWGRLTEEKRASLHVMDKFGTWVVVRPA